MDTNRRTFLKQAGVGLAAAYATSSLFSCSSQHNRGASSPAIGLQLYTLRSQLDNNAAATIARVADIGYNHVETFGAEISGPTSTSFWGLDTAELSAMLRENGLKTHSGHYDLSAFLTPGDGDEEALKRYIDTAAELGQRYLVVPIPPLLLIDKITEGDYHFMADQLNKGGELTAKYGLKIGYHNHFWEFRTLADGHKGLDILIDNTDKDLVAFELDLFWSEKSGTDSAAYFEKHPGRFPLWHIKDMNKSDTLTVIGPAYDTIPVMNIAADITYTEVGTGRIDFKRIMAEAETAGLQYFFVEQDVITIDPFDSIAKSYAYVKDVLVAR